MLTQFYRITSKIRLTASCLKALAGRAKCLGLITATICCLFVGTTSLVRAQSLVRHTENRADQALRGDFRVDPTTLGMSFSIPLGSYPGRGGSVPVTLNYNSKLWRIDYDSTRYGPGGDIRTWTKAKYAETSTSGWTSSLEIPWIEYSGREQLYYSDGSGYCWLCEPNPNLYGPYYVKRIHVHLPDGSSHELEVGDAPAFFDETLGDFSGIFNATDGSRMWFNGSTSTLHLADGSRYIFSSNLTSIHGKLGQPATTYIDRNGNTLSFDLTNRRWTDTLGRILDDPIPNQAPADGTEQTYNLPGFNGNQLQYVLRWAKLEHVLRVGNAGNLTYTGNKKCTAPVSPDLGEGLFVTQYPHVVHCADMPDGNPALFNPVVLKEIQFPNSTKYQFKYNIYGEIEQVLLPTGGYERYEYAQVIGFNLPEAPYAQSNRGVVQRWVSEDGITENQPWQYSVTASVPYTVRSTAPDASYTERVVIQGAINYQYPFGDQPATIGLTQEERARSSTGQMLRRSLTEWLLPGLPTKQVSIMLDTAGDALAATTTFAYDADLNLFSTSRHDYASVPQTTAQNGAIGSIQTGSLVRKDETTFLVNDTFIDSGLRAAYRARNLLALPSSSRVKNDLGTIVAQSEVKYDETALLTYGAVTGWSDPSTTLRGLPTTTRTWLNTDGTWLETYAQYDTLGNPRKSWDALGNLSQAEYASANHYAYQTLSTSPDPDGAGPVTALTASATYDLNTGLPITNVDANNKTTTFYYDATDVLGNTNYLQRLTKVMRPDNGWTAYGYSDTPGSVFVLSRTALDATRSTEATEYFDGLGRSWRSAQTQASICKDVQFDSMGRAWTTSNPYTCGGPQSWTTMTFDALGRITTIATSDTAVVTTSYSGNAVTVTDQAGKTRKSITDALGRLKEVYEDPNGLNYLTSYSYDTLDNLITVNQGSQTRTFAYDSLKRLTSATNPESGTISYTYDSNSNLLTKTDARGVSSTYSYDALNRNTAVNFSDTTPDILRQYDLATVNGKGRLNQAWQSGTITSATYIDEYDPMGRPLKQRQKFQTNGSGSGDYQTQRTYNLAGGVKDQTYPSFRKVYYAYDDAGRASSFTGELGGVSRNYATGIQYSPWGGLSREQFGTDTPLYHRQHYTNRGQLFDMRVATTDDGSWNRGAIINYYSLANLGFGNTGTDTNGNVYIQQHLIPHNDQMSPHTLHQQNYAYDALNRLSWVGEYLNEGTPTGVQAFTYDRWGNRKINPASWGTGINKQFEVNESNNRLEVPSGQSGTMTYDAAGNLNNDTYSGDGSRVYDAENRMTSAQGINQGAWQYYNYNADGQRVRRKVNGAETWQIYGMDGELLAEYAASAAATNPQKEYGYRNGQLLVTAESTGGTAAILADDFNDNVRDTTKWNLYAVGPNPSPTYEQNGRLEIQSQYSATHSNSGGYVTAATHNLNGKQTSVEVVAPTTNNGGGGNYAGLSWGDSPYKITMTYHYIYYDNTGFIYDPVRDRFLRLRDDVTTQTVYYESSSNGVSWEVRASRSRGSASLDYTVRLYNGNTAGWTSVDLVIFDNFRLEVSDPQPILADDFNDNVRDTTKWNLYAVGPNPSPTYEQNGRLEIQSQYSATHSNSGGYVTAATHNLNGKQTSVEVVAPTTNNGGGGNYAGLSWGDSPYKITMTYHYIYYDNTGSIIDPVRDRYIRLRDDPTTQTVYYESSPNGVSWEVRASRSRGSASLDYTIRLYNGNTAGWTSVDLVIFDNFRLEVSGVSGSQGSAVTNINWLVADHLGTPRMVFDKTGSLANVERHDYLPFGEELFAGTGGRTADDGYTGESVRQKFTSKERDNETGLDYFLARYYSSTQGRFTSPDEFNGGPDEVFVLGSGDNRKQALPYAEITQPQSLNKYTYVYNNPCRYVDPDGHCGTPSGLKTGQVGICVASFIASKLVWGVAPTPGRGDGRGPSGQGGTSRVEVRVAVDVSKGTVTKTDEAMSRSGIILKDVGPQGSGGSHVSSPNKDEKGNIYFQIHQIGTSNTPAALIGDIENHLNMVVTPDGKVGITDSSTAKDYPSLEVYKYTVDDKGNVTTTLIKHKSESGNVFDLRKKEKPIKADPL